MKNKKLSNEIIKLLGKPPNSAERFDFSSDGYGSVEILSFSERPYKGATTIITNGVSNLIDGYKNELIMIYEDKSIKENVDLKGFLASYIQLHYLINYKKVEVGDCFIVGGSLIRDYKYEGIYTTKPVYYKDRMLDSILNTNFYWLIPIFHNEYRYIDLNGFLKFESFLELNDPNMAIFNRNSLDFN